MFFFIVFIVFIYNLRQEHIKLEAEEKEKFGITISKSHDSQKRNMNYLLIAAIVYLVQSVLDLTLRSIDAT